ncbi:L,D-transpeptidase [Agrobacterium vitis]|uniref:L,D-transpeptidase n=1 Tax=Agrobacterium vitis TaxID=373 RepID=UPI0012E87540|nr:L,D-transpeptidase [Agrobacterium vitis]
MSVSFDTSLSRRSLLSLSAMAAASAVAGCTSTSGAGRMLDPQPTRLLDRVRPVQIAAAPTDSELAVIYGPIEDGGFLIPAVPYKQIDPRYYRQQVIDPTGEAPGTVVVDTPSRFLYLVQPGGTAMRYGVGIGRDGFAWQGNGVIQWRQKWPRWKPPNEMVARQPELAKYSIENGGMEPGLKNPLGARALYIFSGGQDTLYRLHGNPQWRSIGKAVSSGCVRLLNQDIIDLYERVPIKAPIVVKQ